MCLILTWFKEYSVEDVGYMKISFHKGDDYSFCYHNAFTLNQIFGQIRNIPRLESFENDEGLLVSEVINQIEDILIPPKDMVEVCNILLSDVNIFIKPCLNEQPLEYMVDYVEMIKKKSEQGYYVVFEVE